MLEHFLSVSVYLLAVTAVCVAVFKRFGMGSVLGLLLAGVIIGPYTPGPVATTEVQAVREFTQVGVVLLLFIIGLEIEPMRLWRMRREVFGLGLAQILLSGVVLAVYAHFFIAASPSYVLAIGIGLTFALSSTAFVLQMLEERSETATQHGRVALAVLLMQDLAVVPLLALVPVVALATGVAQAESADGIDFLGLAMSGGLVIAVILAGYYFFPWTLGLLVKHRNMDAFLLLALLAVLSAAWAMEHAGMSMELGAFMMGMLLSRTMHRQQLIAHIQPFKGITLSLFFVSVGMSIDVSLLLSDFFSIMRDVIAIMAIKAVVMVCLFLLWGLSRSVALRSAFILAQCGEFGFVLFGIAHEIGIFGAHTFLSGLMVITASMVATPFVAKAADIIVGRWRSSARVHAGDLPPKAGEHSAHVIVAGYGRIGRTLCSQLEALDVPYIALETDHARVSSGKRLGHNVFIGDIRDINILSAVGMGQAALVVVTVGDAEAAAAGVSHIRQFYAHVPIIARVPDLNVADTMVKMGVTLAIPETVEASLQFNSAALKEIGIPSAVIEGSMAALRADDYELLRLPARELESHLKEVRFRLDEETADGPDERQS